MDKRLVVPAQLLQAAFGVTATLAGLDKFFNILADWQSYISPVALQILPIPAAVLMGIVGVVEIDAADQAERNGFVSPLR